MYWYCWPTMRVKWMVLRVGERRRSWTERYLSEIKAAAEQTKIIRGR